MTTRTSPSPFSCDCRARIGARRSCSPGSSPSVAARADERAVSGRRAPGIATTFGPRPRSHASATSAGVASWSRDAAQGLVALEPGSTAWPAERRVGDHRDPELAAASDDTSAQSPVVEWADRNLDGVDRRKLHGLVQLGAVHIADSDARDQAVGDEPCERANRRRPGRARIRRVEEIEVDRPPAECLEARLAIGADRLRATVRDPCLVRSRHTALRHDPHPVRIAERASEQLLVALVRPCGVEHGDPRAEGSGDRLVRLLREPHAAEADAQLVGPEPVRHGALPAARRNASRRLASSSTSRRVVRGAGRTARPARGRPRSTTGRRRSRRRGTSPGPHHPGSRPRGSRLPERAADRRG